MDASPTKINEHLDRNQRDISGNFHNRLLCFDMLVINSDPMLWFILFACVFCPLLLYFVMTRNDEGLARTVEIIFRIFGFDFPAMLICVFNIAFSFNKSRKEREKREVAIFTKESKEVERRIERYEHFAEISSALRHEASVRQLNEGQEVLLMQASMELETLPGQVYDGVQFLENYKYEKIGNAWLRFYIYQAEERHRLSGECARRLGCCAASCGCCTPSQMISQAQTLCAWQGKGI